MNNPLPGNWVLVGSLIIATCGMIQYGGRRSIKQLTQLHQLYRYSVSITGTCSDGANPRRVVNVPTHASVVIIGGGIIGNSIAYHLGKLGVKDVVLLEQSKLTSGTTWHAAGLMVTFGSLSETYTSIRQYSRRLYNELEQDTGLATGFKPVGK